MRTKAARCAGKHAVWPLVGVVGALLGCMATAVSAQPAAAPARGVSTRLEGTVKEDFDGLLERRVIRVAVPYSRSLYFNDKGRERGTERRLRARFRASRQPEVRGSGSASGPITVIIRRHDARPAAEARRRRAGGHRGRQPHGDRGAPGARGLRRARQREAGVRAGDHRAEVAPPAHLRRPLGKDRPRPQVVELLREPGRAQRRASSRRASRRPTSSSSRTPSRTRTCWRCSTRGCSRRSSSTTGRPACGRRSCPRSRSTTTSSVRDGGKIGWAIRKNSPKLSAELNEFYTSSVKKQGVVNMRMKAVLRSGQAAQGPDRDVGEEALREHRSRSSASTGASTASTR